MPHLTLEYTSNLDSINADRILLALNHALVASEQFEEQDIKSRAIRLDVWRVGVSSSEHAFVHVKLAILSGRSAQVKSELSNALLCALRTSCKGIVSHPVQLCVEVLEIERPSYAKETVHAGPV